MSKPSRDEMVAAIEVLFAKRRTPLNARQRKVFGLDEWQRPTAEDAHGDAAGIVADAILGAYETEDDGR